MTWTLTRWGDTTAHKLSNQGAFHIHLCSHQRMYDEMIGERLLSSLVEATTVPSMFFWNVLSSVIPPREFQNVEQSPTQLHMQTLRFCYGCCNVFGLKTLGHFLKNKLLFQSCLWCSGKVQRQHRVLMYPYPVFSIVFILYY